jgi:hypothetical protein
MQVQCFLVSLCVSISNEYRLEIAKLFRWGGERYVCLEDSDRSPSVEDLFGGKGLGFTANAVVQRMAFTLDL